MNINQTAMCHTRVWIAVATVLAWTAFDAPAARASGLLIADGGFGGVLEIEEHSVTVTINNGIAVTEVEQVFVNTENRQVEALYTFPVPKHASVSDFSMWIQGKEMIGEVVEKQRAREIYNSYKRQRRDPGLLEQVDYKTFEMRIFPIEPRARQRVKITYYQELDIDHDWVTYVYPLATVTRRQIDQRTTGRFGLNLDVKSEVPIVAMESPSHKEDFVIARHAEDFFQASLETSSGDLSRDLVISYQLSRPATGIDVIASKQRGEDGYFYLTLTSGDDTARQDVGMDYVFVLDVSGSMAQGDKLPISRGQLNAFVNVLGDQDRFDVITFNVDASTLFNQLAEVSNETREQAVQFLASRKARGGTILSPALAIAYKYRDPDRTLNVVVLSDGLTEQGERQSLFELIRSRPQNTRVFCIGVGNEVNRPMLEQLAEEAGGLATFLSRGDDFDRQAKAFQRKLMHPVATDVRIALEGVQVYDVEPPVLPNLFYGSPIRILGRYKGSGPVSVRVQAFVDGGLIDQTSEINLPKADDQNPQIERMWSWHRIRRLLNEADSTGSRSAVMNEVVRLGEAYSIVTEYTSFIVLENDGEYKRWKIDRRNELRIQRDRRSREKLRAQLRDMRSEALAELGPSPTPTRLAHAKPPTNVLVDPAPRSMQPTRQTPMRQQQTRRRPSFGGGGAFDPLTAAGAASLAGWMASRIRRRREKARNGRHLP